jgi:RimJ/RimL family protein N-acetyltransferase
MITLTTARLRLEPLTAAHAEAMFGVLGDPAVWRYLDGEAPADVATLRGQYERQQRGRSADGREVWLNWIVFAAAPQPLGYVQATVLDDGCAWVAYALASAHWGRGYAREAMHAMLAHLEQAHRVRSLLATVERDNAASIRLLETLGFTPASASAAAPHGLSDTERLYCR